MCVAFLHEWSLITYRTVSPSRCSSSNSSTPTLPSSMLHFSKTNPSLVHRANTTGSRLHISVWPDVQLRVVSSLSPSKWWLSWSGSNVSTMFWKFCCLRCPSGGTTGSRSKRWAYKESKNYLSGRMILSANSKQSFRCFGNIWKLFCSTVSSRCL